MADVEWKLPCELRDIEPGIIFSLTHRDGPTGEAEHKYPAPPFNNIYYRHHVACPSTFTPSAAVKESKQNETASCCGNGNVASPAYNAVNADQQLSGGSNMKQRADAAPLTILSQPMYVNPKQYHRILRRREIRTQLRNRWIRENKMHVLYSTGDGRKQIKFKSRHELAKRRPRGPHGQFLSNKDSPDAHKQSKRNK